MITVLGTFHDTFYEFTYPINLIPKYKAAGSVKKKGSYLNGQFGMDLHITSEDPIELVRTKTKFKTASFSEDKRRYHFKIEM